MLRILMAGLMIFAASGCTFGLPSAVDAAPFEARPAKAPFADGEYCGLDDDEDGQLVVRSAEADDDNNCAAFTWDAARRVFVLSDESDETRDIYAVVKPGELAIADLGDGLLLLQFNNQEAEQDPDTSWPFMLMAGMAHGDAIAILPLPSDERVVTYAASYPGVRPSPQQNRTMGPPVPDDAPADATPASPDRFYISGGAPEDIRSLARALIVGGMREMTTKADEREPLPAHGVFTPVLVRAEAGRPDHPVSAGQQRDIDWLMAKLRALGAAP